MDPRPGDVGHRGGRLQQGRGEEEVVGARGRQVQRHHDVEGQREHREVPLAEDGAQGTGEDGAGGRSMGDAVQEAPGPDTGPRGSRGSSGLSGEPSLHLTGPELSFPHLSSLSLGQRQGDAQTQPEKGAFLGGSLEAQNFREKSPSFVSRQEERGQVGKWWGREEAMAFLPSANAC